MGHTSSDEVARRSMTLAGPASARKFIMHSDCTRGSIDLTGVFAYNAKNRILCYGGAALEAGQTSLAAAIQNHKHGLRPLSPLRLLASATSAAMLARDLRELNAETHSRRLL